MCYEGISVISAVGMCYEGSPMLHSDTHCGSENFYTSGWLVTLVKRQRVYS